jgi:hypothetical protein
MRDKVLIFYSVMLAFLFLPFFSISAQTGRISGKVIDEDNLSLAGANVYIKTLGLG